MLYVKMSSELKKSNTETPPLIAVMCLKALTQSSYLTAEILLSEHAWPHIQIQINFNYINILRGILELCKS